MKLATFQYDVLNWLMRCFGPAIGYNKPERTHRFLEEALELAQACGCTEQEAIQLVRYTYSRPIGEGKQEVGGVMVTLAALCAGFNYDLEACAEQEYARITDPETMERIRLKQLAKPRVGPLPGVYPLRKPGMCSGCNHDDRGFVTVTGCPVHDPNNGGKPCQCQECNPV